MVYWIAYFGTKLLSFLFFPVDLHGRENVPKEGAFLLVCNHTSYLDPMIMGIVTGRRLSYMARDTLFRNPWLGFILPRLGVFPIKRNTADKKAIRESLDRLARGLPLLLFPEGTRHGASGEKKIEAGAGFLALKKNVPVIPVYIAGSEKVLPPGAKFFKRGRIRVRFGRPLVLKDEANYEEASRKIMDAVYALPAV